MLCAFSAEQFSFVRVLLNVLSKYQVLGGDRPAGSVWFTGHAGTVLWIGGQAKIIFIHFVAYTCLQCFDAVGWAAGRASGP